MTIPKHWCLSDIWILNYFSGDESWWLLTLHFGPYVYWWIQDSSMVTNIARKLCADNCFMLNSPDWALSSTNSLLWSTKSWNFLTFLWLVPHLNLPLHHLTVIKYRSSWCIHQILEIWVWVNRKLDALHFRDSQLVNTY